MRRLQDELQLQGTVETVNATELRAHLGECLTQAAAGKAYAVKRKGRVLCYICRRSWQM